MYINECEIQKWVTKFDTPATPNLRRASHILENLMHWTNRNSDGWPYWPKPRRAAQRLIALLDDADNRTRFKWVGRLETEDDCTAAELRAAIVPVKSFLTRQGVTHTEVIPA